MAPPGQHAERGVGAGERVDGFVDRAVAAEDDHEVDAVVHRLGGELVRVATLLGLGDLQPEVGRQRLLDDREGGLGHRPRDGVDDEEDAMEAQGHGGSSMTGVPLSSRRVIGPYGVPGEPPETGGSSATSSPWATGVDRPARSPFTTIEPTAATFANRSPITAGQLVDQVSRRAAPGLDLGGAGHLAEGGEQANRDRHRRSSVPARLPTG